MTIDTVAQSDGRKEILAHQERVACRNARVKHGEYKGMSEPDKGVSFLKKCIRLFRRIEKGSKHLEHNRSTWRRDVLSQVDIVNGIARKLVNDLIIANIVACACHTLHPFW